MGVRHQISSEMPGTRNIVTSHFAATSQDNNSCGALPSLESRFVRSWLECSLRCIIGLVSNTSYYVCSSFTFDADDQLCHLSQFDIRYEIDLLPRKVFSRKVNSFVNVVYQTSRWLRSIRARIPAQQNGDPCLSL